MYMFLNALIMALLLPAAAEQKAADGPACRAQLSGLELRTRLDLPTGIRIEGPWRIVHRGDMAEGEARYILFAQLDHVIQHDRLTGERDIIPFPEPVRLAFEGPSQVELVRRAARTWCVTVMRAQHNQAADLTGRGQNSTLITALPRPVSADAA
jgi:hypothetical protein